MRYAGDEATYILGSFVTGDTVTIDIYDLSDDSLDVDDGACSEIASTGIFKYLFNPDAGAKQYAWIMSNGSWDQRGKMVFGGYLDDVLDDTNELVTDDVPSLISALNDPAAVTVADAVWDELATGHIDAGKAGEQLWTDVDAILADTGELQNDDVPGLIAALNDPTAAAMADAVWDEDVVAAHNTADTAGALIDDIATKADFKADVSNLDQAISTTEGNIRGADSDDLKVLSDQLDGLNDPAASAIADAVWDEASAGHIDAGKAGQQLWTDIDAILEDTNELQTDDVPGLIAALNDPDGAAIADAVHDEVVEGTLTLRHIVRIMLAVLAGKADGGGTATVTFRDYADGKDRVTATVTVDGDRTSISLDGT